MKKRLITGILAVLLLVSLLPIPAFAALDDYVTSITGKSSGYAMVNVGTGQAYGPKFGNFTVKSEHGSPSWEFQVSAFHANQNMTSPCTSAPKTGSTYYFTIQSDYTMIVNYEKLKPSNITLTMDGVTCTVLKVDVSSKQEGSFKSTAVKITCSAKITAQPITSLTIKDYTAPKVGSAKDGKITADNCNVYVNWYAYDKTSNKWNLHYGNVTATDWLQATLQIIPKSGYYFADGGRNVFSASYLYDTGFGVTKHSTNEIMMHTPEYQMETVTRLDMKFTSVDMDSSDSCYYLNGGSITRLDTNTGKKYTLSLSRGTLYSDEEFSKNLKREPKEGNTYYLRTIVTVPEADRQLSLKELDSASELSVTLEGYKAELVQATVDGYSYGHKLRAYWKLTKLIPTFTVSFDANGGSGTMASVEIEEGTQYTLPACTFTPPAGMVFDVWQVGGREREPGYELRVNESVTITALWKDEPVTIPTGLEPISVYYHNADGREVQLLKSTDSKREITIYLDELSQSVSGGLVHFVTYTDPPAEKEGLVSFSSSNTGIYSRFSYQHNDYDDSDEVLILFNKEGKTIITAKLANGTKQTVTVNVKASKGYKVSFNAGSGSGTMNPVTVENGTYTLPANRFEAPEGKQFKAWKVNGSEKQPGSKITVTADITVTAVWEDMPEDRFTVKFDADGGKGTMRNVTQTGDNKYTLPECKFTAPDGKMFKAWFYDGKEWQPGDEIGLQGDVNTVKALWVDLPMDHICDTEKVAKVKPTETEPGKEAYYVCTGCGNAYEDKAATKLIEDLESWGIIAPLGGESEGTEGTEDTEPVQTKPQKGPGQFSGGDNKEESAGMPWWIVVLICLVCAGGGLVVTLLILKKKKA